MVFELCDIKRHNRTNNLPGSQTLLKPHTTRCSAECAEDAYYYRIEYSEVYRHYDGGRCDLECVLRGAAAVLGVGERSAFQR